jgi:hypothetical protein
MSDTYVKEISSVTVRVLVKVVVVASFTVLMTGRPYFVVVMAVYTVLVRGESKYR